jgi:urea carboxylase
MWNTYRTTADFKPGTPWLLRFFDQVRFYPVSETELNQLREDFREGRASLRIEETQFDFAAHQQFLADHAAEIAAFRQRQATACEQEVQLWAQEEQNAPAADEAQASVSEEEEAGLAVQADLNGNIWKVLVQPGDEVSAGQTLIIVEAMKMELAIVAPQAGRVTRIACQAGRPVSPGDHLLWLE